MRANNNLGFVEISKRAVENSNIVPHEILLWHLDLARFCEIGWDFVRYDEIL